ncbi:hypothetical protein VIBNIAM115_1020001 [Vibrio nigripulchritudo AM115]|nr:hypothetical protein VIBNIAM115_1020001 [Vibrio nigripulchritudo AM115]
MVVSCSVSESFRQGTDYVYLEFEQLNWLTFLFENKSHKLNNYLRTIR